MDVDTLREMMDLRFAALERVLDERDERYSQRFDAQEKAGAVALLATKEALSAALAAAEKGSTATVEANRVLAKKTEEFADQKVQTHNAIRPWVETLINAQSEKIVSLERRISRFENREEGLSLSTKLVVGAIGLIATLLGIYLALSPG